MKTHRLCVRQAAALAWFLCAVCAAGQVVPTTPKKFTTRPITGGGSASTGVTNKPTPPPTYRTVTYLALGESRQWTSSDGKSLLGKLIAFEDIVVVTQTAPDANAAPPALPEKPTVIRDGKARLLVSSKPYEIPLERLSEDDRSIIEAIQAAVDAKAKKAQQQQQPTPAAK